MLFSIILGLSGSASAVDFEPKYDVALETGHLANRQDDSGWDYIGYPENTVGLRLGYNLSSRLAVVASYQSVLSRDSQSFYSYDEDSSSDIEDVQTQFRSNQISVGPKLSLPLKRWFVPYATAQGLVVHGLLKMGDTVYADESTTFLRDSAFGVGTIGGIGLELRTRPLRGKAQLNTYFEWGGGISTNMNFKAKDMGVDQANLTIGDLQYGGQYFRFGVGTRF